MKKESAQKNSEKHESAETWRKPLQVPPRANPMRSFYRSDDQAMEEQLKSEPKSKAQTKNLSNSMTDETEVLQSLPKKIENELKPSHQEKSQDDSTLQLDSKETQLETLLSDENNQSDEVVVESTSPTASNLLTKEELSFLLGFELEDMFDVHELLRGKSFELYRSLWEASQGGNGRCKLTQPELMRRTEIKNRRTFYKHEEWLLKLRLLEKRHLPGDHKGVVYKVFSLHEALPLERQLIEQFEKELKTSD